MWKLIIVFSLTTLQITCGKLVGDHICRTEERYTVNVTEHFVKTATVRNYKWCLNIPPRCSYYTIKKINDTRIAKRNDTKFVEKCCPGFFEKEHQCIPNCENCKNGMCRERKCLCASGYVGLNCDTTCSEGFWGPNCTYSCDCNETTCSPKDGQCLDSSRRINTGIYTKPTPPTTLYDVTSQSSTSNSISENNNIIESSTYFTVTTNDVTMQETELKPYQTAVQNILLVKQSRGSTKSTQQSHSNLEHNLFNGNVELLIPVGIRYDKIAKPLVTPSTSSMEKENYMEEDHELDNRIPSKAYYVINSLVVSAITTATLIILAVVIFTMRRKYKPKQTLDNKKNVAVSTVAVYTTSIFHTPLPDPPTCDNPSYLSSMECRKCLNEPEVETHFHYTLKAPIQQRKDSKIYEYDYPPSSGSYRAASIIEPLDPDTSSKIICTETEPVYDEIPCRRDYESIPEAIPDEHQSMSLYMNTCDFTKFK